MKYSKFIQKILSQNIVILFLLSILYLFLRLYNLPHNVNFSDEQGKFLLDTFSIWKYKHLTLIGPPTSFNFEGRYFFQGPLIYYILIPFMLLGQWNPLFGSYCLVFLNLIAVWLIFFAGKKISGLLGGFIASLCFVIFPEIVYYTKFVWNPNFLPAIAAVLLVLLVKVINLKSWFRVLLIGFFLGVGLQFHYQVVMLIFSIFIYLVVKEKIRLKEIILFISGFLIGYAPLVFFELRHNFYNTQTIILLLKNGVFLEKSSSPSYYLLSLFPFLFVFVGYYASKLWSRHHLFCTLLICVIVFACLAQDLRDLSGNRGMPKGWTYIEAEKTSQIIISENKTRFNVANLLSGDTRAYAERYLLAIRNKSPLDVSQYPNASYLFVISYLNKDKATSYPVWEISSFKGRIVKTWTLAQNPMIYLYEFKKN